MSEVPLHTDYFHLPGNETVVAIVDESSAVCARHAAGVPDLNPKA